MLTNAATTAENVVGLVYVAAFAPDEGEVLGQVTAGSKDSVLDTALVPLHYPSGDGGESAVEFTIDPAKFHGAFAADLPAAQSAVLAATQRPVAEAAFSEPSGRPHGSACPPGPSWHRPTRRRALTLSVRWRNGPARRSPSSRARTSS